MVSATTLVVIFLVIVLVVILLWYFFIGRRPAPAPNPTPNPSGLPPNPQTPLTMRTWGLAMPVNTNGQQEVNMPSSIYGYSFANSQGESNVLWTNTPINVTEYIIPVLLIPIDTTNVATSRNIYRAPAGQTYSANPSDVSQYRICTVIDNTPEPNQSSPVNWSMFSDCSVQPMNCKYTTGHPACLTWP